MPELSCVAVIQGQRQRRAFRVGDIELRGKEASGAEDGADLGKRFGGEGYFFGDLTVRLVEHEGGRGVRLLERLNAVLLGLSFDKLLGLSHRPGALPPGSRSPEFRCTQI